ncbi:MAG: DUF4386 domain-containing protein [Myxococcales bacterium]|nr:DUF4386 domain-containing protein [Myxococcales bacterium]MCB9533981.1 DUF4386 domain-containing protein [Myxococcales bacterium]
MSPTPRTVGRLTGLAYLAMIPGGIAYLTLRPQLVGPEPASTLAYLMELDQVARLSVAGTMSVVVAQALTALGFFALYRARHPVVGFGVAAFGLLNAAALVVAAAAAAAALGLATVAAPADPAAAAAVHSLALLEGAAWDVGGLFFGLWLIPMGVGAARSGYFHAGRALGGLLVVGGVAYVAGAFLALIPQVAAAGVPDMLGALATIGELWTIGALLVVGVRGDTGDAASG